MIQHLFTVPSSLLVHHSALPQSLPLLLLSCFSFMLNSAPKTPCSFIFSQISLFSASSFPHFSHSQTIISFSSLLSIHFPFHIHRLSCSSSSTSSSPSPSSPISPLSPFPLPLCLHPAVQLSHRNEMKTLLPSVLSHP